MSSIYVFDPTAGDEMSRVRGIGRYVQILKENFEKDWKFTADINEVPADSTFINPFLNFLQPPLQKTPAKKQIAVIHDLIPLKYPKQFPIGLRGRLHVFLNKQSLKNYDTIITDSQASKKDIMQLLKIPEEKIEVIYPILSKNFSKKKTTSSPSSTPNKYCIYVGDATWNKNLETLAKAIKEINVTCMFVGKVFKTTEHLDHPWQKELRDFLLETQNDKRFVFPGYVSDEELVNLYKNARCNVLVSRDEGFGFSYLESASAGTPSVLSNIDVLKETAVDSALFAKPDNHVDIANQIGQLYFENELRDQLGKKAQTRSKFFSQKTFKEAFMRMEL